ncbi:MAG: protein kinase [Elusimicrobia bacterium]|nr:protein kinase [Elusimicrobiota bacterium]
MRRIAKALPSFLLAAGLCSAALAAPPSAGEKKKPAKSDAFKGKTTFGIMAVMEDQLQNAPPSPGRDEVEKVLKPAVDEIGRKLPSERDKAADKKVDAVTLAAESVDLNSEPAETARLINNEVAYLNTSAGHFETARDFSEREIARDPTDRDAYINRSMANYGLNKLKEAYGDADRATRLDPDSPDAYRARAMASYGMRNYLQAIEDSRRALALDPNDKTAFAIMKLSESRVPAMDLDTIKSRLAGEIQREYHGMVQQMSQIAQKGQQPAMTPIPQAAEKMLRQAAGKITVKDYQGAVDDADRAIGVDPGNPGAYYYRAAALNLLGRYEEAEADASRALVLSPSDFSLRDTRAWALNHMGRFRDAIADSNHSLEVNPKNPYAFANRGYSYEQMGDLDTMLRDLKVAAALSPQFEPAYRDAAARHGLDLDPAATEKNEAQRRAERDDARRRSFLTVLASSAIGGLLIAAGFLHLTSSEKPAKSSPVKAVTVPGLNLSKLEAGYVLGRQLGIGGMGIVYEAVDKALQRKVAVKILRDELKRTSVDRERFLDEARTVAALHHPNIVDIHSIVEDLSGVYLIFEYIDGRDLHTVLSERGRLTVGETKALLRQVCAGLDYAHHHGVVHRDLKPGNIMVTDQGLVKVMDFGISRHALDAAGPLSPHEKATACGTPDYMAPEQEEGLVRRESDVFSLGCLLYELTTGRRVYPGQDTGSLKLARNYTRPSHLVDGLSPELDRIVDWALHPDPAQRIRSVRDFWALLERVPDRVGTPIAAS